MSTCPSCKYGYCYMPFYGKPECVNSSCEFYSGHHYLAMKSEIEKKPEAVETKSFDVEEDEDDTDHTGGWSPYYGGLFKPTPYRYTTAPDPSNQTYDQAVSASIARAKKKP